MLFAVVDAGRWLLFLLVGSREVAKQTAWTQQSHLPAMRVLKGKVSLELDEGEYVTYQELDDHRDL
jgi:hypothetical protein